MKDAVDFAESIGYPVIVRPAYTLGGTGGGIAYDQRSLEEIAARVGRMESGRSFSMIWVTE